MPLLANTMRGSRQGFSLLELSVVIAIVSVVITLGLEMTASYANRNAYETTRDTIGRVDTATRQFFAAYGRLPCPADPALTATSPAYGIEDCSRTGLYHPAPVGGGVIPGAVPFRTLNLSTNLSVDAFGNKLNYYVTRNLMFAGSGLGQFAHSGNANPMGDGLGGIEIRSGKLATDCTTVADACFILANPRTTSPPPCTSSDACYAWHANHCLDYNTPGDISTGCAGVVAYPKSPAVPLFYVQSKRGAAYAIFSNGADERGAYPRNSATKKRCFINQDSVTAEVYDRQIDSKNCAEGAPADLTDFLDIPRNVLYDSRFNNSPDQPTTYFDDVIVWRTKEDL